MLYLRAGSLNNLFTISMDRLMNDPSTWDAEQTPRILSYNNLLLADNLDFDFDLSHVGFTRTRWARYTHQYIDKDQLNIWLDNLKDISKRGDNLFRSKDAVRRPREHRHGSCWLGISYRNTPPTLVLYSRVAEFPTRAALELTMSHLMGEEIRKTLNLNNRPIKFVWFISSLFLSCLHMLPWLSRNGLLEQTYKRQDSVGEFVRHQIDHINRGKIRYGPTKRMAKRLEQIRTNTVKPVPIEGLNLWI